MEAVEKIWTGKTPVEHIHGDQEEKYHSRVKAENNVHCKLWDALGSQASKAFVRQSRALR